MSRMRECAAGGAPVRVIEHPGEGSPVVVLHGGPGAPGTAAPLARGLAGPFRVLEVRQRASGGVPLTVERHVEDLHELLVARGLVGRVGIVGHSWGAMLALAHGAAHPGDPAAIALVGCGTFDPETREQVRATRSSRMDAATRERMEALTDPGERLRHQAEILSEIDSYAIEAGAREPFEVDVPAYEQSWSDMLRLQEDGTYPQAFSAIRAPVLMLHGDVDPHPGARIHDGLAPYVPLLEYREIERCGHLPWYERWARQPFFSALRAWLDRRLGTGGEGAVRPAGRPRPEPPIEPMESRRNP